MSIPALHAGFGALPGEFYTHLNPSGLPNPWRVAYSPQLGSKLGLPGDFWTQATSPDLLCGNQNWPASQPLAAVYSGHQFGVWAGQLGDGRAHLLGTLATPDGLQELQLKGAGQTPYSRFGDGRAVLRSSIREFLCSEAMAGLGIPTTRALSIVGSALPVMRESTETAAVVLRVAPSFVRFGNFEHWAAQGRTDLVKTLADYLIENFWPQLADTPRPYHAWLAEVTERTARLIADWQAVGFMHGVMNTDNFSILGLTIDYGPFGFMEAFDAHHICNHSDSEGRYRFAWQPRIAHWNLYALASACRSLIAAELPANTSESALEEALFAHIDTHYVATYESAFLQKMRAKLGLCMALPSDETLLQNTYALLQAQHLDHTHFFRALSYLPSTADAAQDARLRDQFIDREAGDAWLAEWRQRLGAEDQSDAARQTTMQATNPHYVLRNWLAEQAIRAAQQGDYREIERLYTCLSAPFTERAEFNDYARLPPDWAAGLEVSCSS